MLGDRDKIYTINLELTGLCNSFCSYCHFYLKHDRNSVAYHMPLSQFNDYLQFVKYWHENSGGITNYRFSGGDPITLKDDLFNRANLAYEITGLHPFLLTHGRNLKEEWFKKAQDSSFEAIYFSVENPICPDYGAQNPEETIKYVNNYNSSILPIKLGVCIVPNDQFGNILKICDWFYERVGYIPPLAEVNYGAYVSATEKQWSDLKKSLHQVLSKYYGKTHLNLFHSVSPELAYNGADPYVFNLGLINKFSINSSNIEKKALEIVDDIKYSNYPLLNCNQECNWRDFCVNTKWYWQGDENNSKSQKIIDYCRFKRLINDTYYRTIVDMTHEDTNAQINMMATSF